MLPRMKNNFSKLLAVSLDRLALRMSHAELNTISTGAELGRGGAIFDKKFQPHLPVVAGENVFVDEGFAVSPLPAVQGVW